MTDFRTFGPTPAAGGRSLLGRRLGRLALAAILCLPGAAIAQTAGTGDAGETETNPCQVEPQDGDTAEDRTTQDRTAEDRTDDGPSLSDCNGVLTPPPTGDPEIREPAPDTGTTPVIPPGAVPQQPPG